MIVIDDQTAVEEKSDEENQELNESQLSQEPEASLCFNMFVLIIIILPNCISHKAGRRTAN